MEFFNIKKRKIKKLKKKIKKLQKKRANKNLAYENDSCGLILAI
jgi:hypothetical protein